MNKKLELSIILFNLLLLFFAPWEFIKYSLIFLSAMFIFDFIYLALCLLILKKEKNTSGVKIKPDSLLFEINTDGLFYVKASFFLLIVSLLFYEHIAISVFLLFLFLSRMKIKENIHREVTELVGEMGIVKKE